MRRYAVMSLAVLAACSEYDGPCERIWGTPLDPEPCTDTAEGTVQRYAYAMGHKRLSDFRHLLHPDFRFEPTAEDGELLAGVEWTCDVELAVLRGMFSDDPLGVDSIELRLHFEGDAAVGDGAIRRAVCPFTALLLTVEGTVLHEERAEGVLEVDLAPGVEDARLFQIIRLHEVAPPGAALTWGRIRAQYYRPDSRG